MLVSYHWLKKFAEIEVKPQEVADRLTLSLAEIESVKKRGDDTIMEIENKGLTHRPDCFSHLGIAREIAAVFKTSFYDPLFDLTKRKIAAVTKFPIKIEVKNSKFCPRYCALVLTNLKVGESTKWMRAGLTNAGVRPINNVVDITNYTMLELGQPLHAFDYEKIDRQKVVVRLAKKGEEIVTLDGIKRKLDSDNLVIADSKKPIGLAGIMGGENTEVSSNTKTIVLESANFEARNNRISSKNLKLRTEATTRFEKDLDINLPLPALNRAVELFQDLAEAEVASELFDIQSKAVTSKKVKVSPEWINKFLGLNLSVEKMVEILKSLQLETKIKGDLLVVTIPTFRKDLTMEADIAEEVARIYGYEKIPITLPVLEVKTPPINWDLKWQKETKQFLKGAGFTEVFTNPFVGVELLKKSRIEISNHLQLVNPLSPEREFMRQTLVSSLLEVVKSNLPLFNQLRIFELARVYLSNKKSPLEQKRLSGAVVGGEFYEVKGVAETLLEELGIKDFEFSPIDNQCLPFLGLWKMGKVAIISSESKEIGILGEADREILKNFEIGNEVVLFDFDFEVLAKLATSERVYQPISIYPPVIEDLSLVVDQEVLVGEVIEILEKLPISGCQLSVDLFDTYEDKSLKKQGKKSLTFHIQYQSSKQQLSSRDIEPIRERLEEELEKKFKAKIRKK